MFILIQVSSRSINTIQFIINNKLKKYKTPQLIKESIYQIPLLRNYLYRYNLRSLWVDYESEENKWILIYSY